MQWTGRTSVVLGVFCMALFAYAKWKQIDDVHSLSQTHIQASTKAPEQFPNCLYEVDVTSIHDGDGFRGDLHMPWKITLRDQSMRFEGFDAWEITKTRKTVEVTDEEIAKGVKARNDLAKLLDSAKYVLVAPGKELFADYNRLSVRPYVLLESGVLVDVVEYMKRRGHERKEE